MNEIVSYAIALEKKLISEFKTKFHDKIGYYPQVITKSELHAKFTSLESLEKIVLSFSSDNSISHLKTRSRKGEVVTLRHLFCYISHKIMHYSSTTVGKYLDRDHATILSSCSTIDGVISSDDVVRELFTKMIEKINSLDTEIKSDEPALECV